MTEWMKLYAVYSLSISPNYSHRTTLLNTKVLNLYITQVGVSKLGSTGIHLLSRMSKRMGHRLLSRQIFLYRSYCHTYSGYPGVGFCLSTGRRPGVSSTRHRRFPGAKGTRLHSFNTACGR